jgi:serine acetyltransferase
MLQLVQIPALIMVLLQIQKSITTHLLSIGKRGWISPNVSIRENVKITDDVFVGIGSVVLRSIKEPCRVFGNPAKKITAI